MKAILEFDLPEDKWYFDCASRGSAWKSIVTDIDEKLRCIKKYESEKYGKEATDLAYRLRVELRENLADAGLVID